MCNKACICIYAAINKHAKKRMGAPNIYAWAIYTLEKLNIYIFGPYVYIYIYIISIYI